MTATPRTFDGGWVTFSIVLLLGRTAYIQKRDGCSRTMVGSPGTIDVLLTAPRAGSA